MLTELCRAEFSWVLEIFTPSPPRKQELLVVGMGWWQASGQDFCLQLGTPKYSPNLSLPALLCPQHPGDINLCFMCGRATSSVLLSWALI